MQNNLNKKEIEALKYIRNCIMHGRSPSVRDVQDALEYGSPRSAALIIESLMKKKILGRRPDNSLQVIKDTSEATDHAKTVSIPLVGSVACGTPIFAQENIEAFYPVSTTLAHTGSKYFLLRAQGDSMNKAGINDGDLVLVRQQNNADSGQKVVALIDDEATVKIIRFTPDAVILEPKSTNKKHKPIILSRDFQIQGIVIAAVPAEKN